MNVLNRTGQVLQPFAADSVQPGQRAKAWVLTAEGAAALKEQLATIDQIAQTGRQRLGLL